MNGGDDRIEPLSPRRRGTVDYMRMAGRRSNVHGLVEVDVTDARAAIDDAEAETGEPLSFTAFVVSCLARAIEDHPDVNAYRDWRGRVHVFEDVDVNVLVETTIDGEQVGVPHVLRRANERSVRSIHDEIRSAQASSDPTNLSWAGRIALRLPGPIRRLVWRLPQVFPRRWKRLAGTVAVTSVGMFGAGGGWAISPTNYTVQLTVGGIDEKPRFVDGELRNREILDLTVTVDHDVVDGAAAARFGGRLRELLEDAHGLDPPEDA
ncbi:pyruvate/2-oxoglutarate dehydrogenase complex, dihydrolipoamide acyltransferase component [Salinarchaeum sp. Harcht-Bsk1]|uniref:2-oxo acid dehydrogenase subunit E2 n=1 Tax=Salinarchaeum sp. Harcht-Bsk1 TaxID=1333523 RepID=UPI0003423CAE|nr:2-oxo acid dehydrogenase subunit E2 [Salinarchaeum sp. Harcht-Bsk1]AGN01647.1 pyruvate/2-oxoglutarate dehydrogenase complex, dihydrolipoamide acyltransferase component [Salinarchaeum sp. Harcht-Bsk1]